MTSKTYKSTKIILAIWPRTTLKKYDETEKQDKMGDWGRRKHKIYLHNLEKEELQEIISKG